MSQHFLLFRALVASTILVSASAASGQAPTAQELVGTWNLTLTSPNGSHPTTLAVTEDGGKLTGALTGLPTTTPVTITTSDKGVTFSFSVDYQGQGVPVVMTGKVDGTEIKGVVDYADGAAAGDFQGARAGAATAATKPGATTSLTGTWVISSADARSGWSMDLTQDGAAVTGALENAENAASLQLNGTIENGTVVLTVSGERSGTMKGTLEGSSLKGNYDIDGHAGTWSASPKP